MLNIFQIFEPLQSAPVIKSLIPKRESASFEQNQTLVFTFFQSFNCQLTVAELIKLFEVSLISILQGTMVASLFESGVVMFSLIQFPDISNLALTDSFAW
jgi:hypothetical protein